MNPTLHTKDNGYSKLSLVIPSEIIEYKVCRLFLNKRLFLVNYVMAIYRFGRSASKETEIKN